MIVLDRRHKASMRRRHATSLWQGVRRGASELLWSIKEALGGPLFGVQRGRGVFRLLFPLLALVNFPFKLIGGNNKQQ